MSARRKLEPPTAEERAKAAKAADALRAVLADPAAAGERGTVHLNYGRKRHVWLHTWTKLPELTYEIGRKVYSHTLLPGWEYTVAEMRTEMIEDLDRLAAEGERPKTATRR